MIHTLGERRIETRGKHFYVAPSADVIGSVRLGEWASVWFGAVLRGDNEWIEIGDGTNVQDATIMHADPGEPVIVGARVTIGHRALLHGCRVGSDSLIGNGAIVLDQARIGSFCIIAAGALVTPRTVIPDNSLVMGSPARVVRQIGDKEREMIVHGAGHYMENARRFAAELAADPRFG